MKVILKQDVRGLGKKGDMVKASDGYARNYLFPKDLAAPADAQNVTEMKNAQNSKQFKYDTEKAAAEAKKAEKEQRLRTKTRMMKKKQRLRTKKRSAKKEQRLRKRNLQTEKRQELR